MLQETISLNRVARELSLRRRHSRLTAGDVVRSEQLEKVLLVLVVVRRERVKETQS